MGPRWAPGAPQEGPGTPKKMTGRAPGGARGEKSSDFKAGRVPKSFPEGSGEGAGDAFLEFFPLGSKKLEKVRKKM